jgi:hypothetical protein
LLWGYDYRVPEYISKALSLNEDQNNALVEALRPLGMLTPTHSFPLQDCVDLAIFLIKTTIVAEKLTIAPNGIRACGGPIDVAVITRNEGLKFVQRKQIAGEGSFGLSSF